MFHSETNDIADLIVIDTTDNDDCLQHRAAQNISHIVSHVLICFPGLYPNSTRILAPMVRNGANVGAGLFQDILDMFEIRLPGIVNHPVDLAYATPAFLDLNDSPLSVQGSLADIISADDKSRFAMRRGFRPGNKTRRKKQDPQEYQQYSIHLFHHLPPS
jgi:hypothetical protein